jgi:glycosyltransferase involved in cell wall biosynthesis
MISKACLIGSYQSKLVEIARFPDIELTVAVPPSWRERGHTSVLERAQTSGYELAVEPIAFNGSFHLHFYPRLGRRMRATRPDIVHIDEEPYNLATYHALRLGKSIGARTLWFSWQNLQRRYPLPFRLIERYNLRNVDYAIAGSAGASAVWRAKGYGGPLAVVPQFGVSTDDFFPRTVRRAPDRGFVIGYVGRLVPEKGVDVLLRASARLGGEWRLAIAGAGPLRSHLETLAHHLGLADRVFFDGHVSSARMPAYYRELDALVLPSLSRPNWVEQFGRVLIEAMAAGVPVVGSDCGEIPRVVGEAGLVFPEGDVTALHDCLARLMRDRELWSHLARRGRERVLARFTQAEIARKTVAVYRELVGEAP